MVRPLCVRRSAITSLAACRPLFVPEASLQSKAQTISLRWPPQRGCRQGEEVQRSPLTGTERSHPGTRHRRYQQGSFSLLITSYLVLGRRSIWSAGLTTLHDIPPRVASASVWLAIESRRRKSSKSSARDFNVSVNTKDAKSFERRLSSMPLQIIQRRQCSLVCAQINPLPLQVPV